MRSAPWKSGAAEPVGTNTIPRASSSAMPAQLLAPPLTFHDVSDHVS